MSFKDESLCSDCQQVDWKDLVERPLDPEFNRKRVYYETVSGPLGRLVRTVEKSHEQLKYSICRCCRILSIIKNDDGEEWERRNSNVHHLEVTTLESQVLLYPPTCQGSLSLLQIGSWHTFDNKTGRGRSYEQGKRYIALFGPGEDPAPFKIPYFIEDFSWMQNAISGCCQRHASCLSIHSLLVPGLLVIDCLAGSSTLSIVSAPKSCQYIALSYVWGSAQDTGTEVEAVIKDAIKFTVKLGLRFLWVDKYCIPQDDSEKHRLIHSMDKIYSQAYVTIIAAAGKTAADGLPGISTIPRVTQMETEVGECIFLELPSIIDSIRTSTWAQRGWTYQEGLLSTRCLVFTDRGVLYHCRERYTEESVQQLVSPKTAASMNNWRFLSRYFVTETNYFGLRVLIAEYTRRDLSYPRDSLDAFLGVLAGYERQNAALVSQVPSKLESVSRSISLPSHIWGLPFREGVPILDWYHIEPPKQQRPDFPTWSWSGWEGGIELGDNPFVVDYGYGTTESEYAPISVEFPDNLTNYCDQETKRLHVTGAVFELKFATQKQARSIIDGTQQLQNTGELPNLDVRTSHHHCVFEVSPEIFAVIRSKLDIEPKAEDQTFGLFVTVEAQESFYIRSIIVLRKGDQSFTRIGCITVADVWKRRFVNIKGAPIDEEILPSNIKDKLLFGQKCTRQRICLD
ncbi:hypothetical protein BOTNAR_0199g00100 [Botryotinia narcissicola]|uniref:Heterokaryon incompatibility domain-containing protein n=1 Tax=Botryotinia narcissicola TaxID=278944 RepID=A0A4Z1I7D3_9HELO|nr:hypothetical protein BOTNAR_0199g00100 [Botryotinia narcissicola]